MYVRQRITVAFVPMIIILVIFVGMLCFTNAKESLLTSYNTRLEAIAKLKADKIEDFFKELVVDTAIAQQYYTVKTYLPLISRLFPDKKILSILWPRRGWMRG